MCFQPYFCNMSRKRISLFIFLFITLLNIAVFIFREHFNYEPYSVYHDLYSACNEQCAQKWEQYADEYSSELKEAKKITDSVVSQYSQTSDKVIAIENFLYGQFHKQLGKPTVDVMNSSPLNQFKKLKASDTAQLWCGNFAHMLSIFCWAQGIVTRNVELKHAAGNHLLNECYLPESGSWMMADITNNLLSATDNKGNFLNVISFKDSVKKNTEICITQSSGDGSKLQTTSLNSVKLPEVYIDETPAYFYHYTDNNKSYAAVEKIKRYFSPVSWYETYQPNNKGNPGFYLKEILIFLWLVSFFVFLFSRTKFRS